jgi:hypothetical protein
LIVFSRSCHQEATNLLDGPKEQAIRVRTIIKQQPVLTEERRLLEALEMHKATIDVIARLMALKE